MEHSRVHPWGPMTEHSPVEADPVEADPVETDPVEADLLGYKPMVQRSLACWLAAVVQVAAC